MLRNAKYCKLRKIAGNSLSRRYTLTVASWPARSCPAQDEKFKIAGLGEVDRRETGWCAEETQQRPGLRLCVSRFDCSGYCSGCPFRRACIAWTQHGVTT